MAHLVGVISDTHGLLRPEAAAALAGSELILHAGDIGSPDVLDALRAIAPVRAVRGNNDHAPWATAIPETDRVELGGPTIFLPPDVSEPAFAPAAAGIDAVVAGHSHKPGHHLETGVLYYTPGSAGPRR